MAGTRKDQERAEQLLEAAEQYIQFPADELSTRDLALLAQAHATLALAYNVERLRTTIEHYATRSRIY